MDARMIAYTLKQNDDGQWSIRCIGSILASGLPFEPALQQAHEMAHTKRMDSGRPTSVEVIRATPDNRVSDEAQRELCWRKAAA
jgi:hypothetical protein